MSWQIIVIFVMGGFLILIPLLTYLSSHRMVGKTVADDKYGPEAQMLYFYSDNCGPCRHMTPIIDQLAEQRGKVHKIDVGQAPDLARKYGVRATPTTILLQEHVIIQVALGAKSQKQLERLLAEIN
jgi:thioredoxin 1